MSPVAREVKMKESKRSVVIISLVISLVMIWPSTLFAEEIPRDETEFSEAVKAAEAILATGKNMEELTAEELAIVQKPARMTFGDENALSALHDEIKKKELAENHYELATGNVEDSKSYQKDDTHDAVTTEVSTNSTLDLVATEPATIVYNESGCHGLVESLADGTQCGYNNWNSTKATHHDIGVIPSK
jgi:hypothetical protein